MLLEDFLSVIHSVLQLSPFLQGGGGGSVTGLKITNVDKKRRTYNL